MGVVKEIQSQNLITQKLKLVEGESNNSIYSLTDMSHSPLVQEKVFKIEKYGLGFANIKFQNKYTQKHTHTYIYI